MSSRRPPGTVSALGWLIASQGEREGAELKDVLWVLRKWQLVFLFQVCLKNTSFGIGQIVLEVPVPLFNSLNMLFYVYHLPTLQGNRENKMRGSDTAHGPGPDSKSRRKKVTLAQSSAQATRVDPQWGCKERHFQGLLLLGHLSTIWKAQKPLKDTTGKASPPREGRENVLEAMVLRRATKYLWESAESYGSFSQKHIHAHIISCLSFQRGHRFPKNSWLNGLQFTEGKLICVLK